MARELSDGARRALLGRLTEDTAADLLSSPEANVFAKAPDLHGWKIISQYPDDPESRWLMNRPSNNCPKWADNELGPVDPNTVWTLRPPPPKPQPKLHVVEGDKPEPPQPGSQSERCRPFLRFVHPRWRERL